MLCFHPTKYVIAIAVEALLLNWFTLVEGLLYPNHTSANLLISLQVYDSDCLCHFSRVHVNGQSERPFCPVSIRYKDKENWFKILEEIERTLNLQPVER